MKKKMYSILTLVLTAVLLLSGCGKVDEYKTEHETETAKISNIKDLEFEYGATPEQVAKKIKNLCIYEDEENGWKATVPIKYKGFKFEIVVKFNADREFQGWESNLNTSNIDGLEYALYPADESEDTFGNVDQGDCPGYFPKEILPFHEALQEDLDFKYDMHEMDEEIVSEYFARGDEGKLYTEYTETLDYKKIEVLGYDEYLTFVHHYLKFYFEPN